jgi:hypothetical protein
MFFKKGVGVQGITANFMGRLICTIKLGTSPEDLPTVIISGYDEIDPGTQVIIYVSKLLTLPVTVVIDIKIGVELIYKTLGGITAFFY